MLRNKTNYLVLSGGIGVIFILVGSYLGSDWLNSSLIGLGAGLVGASLGKYINYRKITRTNESIESYEIEMNDPRNREIKTIAMAKAGRLLDLILIILSVISIFTKQPLWLTVILISLFLLYELFVYLYIVKLNKEM
ncbi:hypothetical protein [Vagococcus intermedius]|uniref:DUF2178 domain-containing protein n=1 Tax=Vagococcus intermedius TaxID=2991418 RepID=A0AAF0I5V3_9ENTE|nr:hypothetical protein [Vagococcus intermedius]WEG72404.1 hypothetical protein OL234_05310 [Vagococcus intermedius]WEG74492.1 hypothetical protein OL235_05315 [Vagococcus intermedius]